MEITKQRKYHTDKKGEPLKTPQAVDEALKDNDDFDFLLRIYHEITESILSLAMAYVDRKNTVRKHHKKSVADSIRKLR